MYLYYIIYIYTRKIGNYVNEKRSAVLWMYIVCLALQLCRGTIELSNAIAGLWLWCAVDCGGGGYRVFVDDIECVTNARSQE